MLSVIAEEPNGNFEKHPAVASATTRDMFHRFFLIILYAPVSHAVGLSLTVDLAVQVVNPISMINV